MGFLRQQSTSRFDLWLGTLRRRRVLSVLYGARAPEYFLPTQVSVLTINNRLPDRRRPLAMGIDAGGTRAHQWYAGPMRRRL